MYPRNAASPERLAIGAVVQISDGAVQTSGVSVKVKPQGASAASGGGTISYEEGIVGYLPTQAETDYTSFQVIAYKTGCLPVAQTIITSASATAGHGGVDWGKVINPTTTLGLSGTTVGTLTTYTGNTPQTGDSYTRIGALGAGLTGITGVTLAASQPGVTIPTVTTLTGHTPQTGDNFVRLGAPTGASHAADNAAIKSDTAATLIDTAEIGAAGAGLTVLASAANLATVAGYIDTEIADIQSRLPAALVSGRMDASVGAMAANTLTASALATDAVNEIQSGLATAAAVADVLADTNELQLDWANGGRLDLILDARSSQASVDTIDGIVDSILVDTAEIGAAGSGLTALASAANLATVAGYLDTEILAIKDKTDNLPAAPASVTDVLNAWTTVLTESYAANDAPFTPAQALYMLWSLLAERSKTGTLLTAKTLAGATAMTFTLDDAANPTAQTRTT